MTRAVRRALLLVGLAAAASGQDFSQRGFFEVRAFGFPQTAPGDSSYAIAEGLLRWEGSYKLRPAIQIHGSLDARTDSHRQAERHWGVSWWDRNRQRPAFAARRLDVILHKGRWTLDVGRQFIRWGKTDILNPTDRFAPRDFLSVVDSDFLAVTAARATWESGAHTLDAVFAPRFTPSRIPLLNQRWAGLPGDLPSGFRLADAGPAFPGGPQYGLRWSRNGSRLESSLAFYEGFNHLPVFGARLLSAAPVGLEVRRFYPHMRMAGGDLVAPLRWFTVKSEAAYFATRTPRRAGQPTADEYILYVVQLERLAGEWFFVGGYAGEAVTARRSPVDFAPDRGFTRALLGRAGYTLDATRSLALDAAIRENGKGLWLRFEYSHLLGHHWRATAGLTWIRGAGADFLGRYQRNSHAALALRYSF